MFSLARDGYPEPLTPQLDGATLEVRSLALAAGEIDCRVHLAERVAQGDRLDFVARYVQRAVDLRDRLGAEDVALVGPVPPSDVGLEHPDYPRTGTLAERAAATRLLEQRLCEEVARLADPTVIAVPIGPVLEEPGTGALDARFTEDGVHVNPLGAERVRAAFA